MQMSELIKSHRLAEPSAVGIKLWNLAASLLRKVGDSASCDPTMNARERRRI